MNNESPVSLSGPDEMPAYKNPGLPSAERVQDLLSRMALEEKTGQRMCVRIENARKLVDAEGNFDLAKAREAFKERRGLGMPMKNAFPAIASGRPPAFP
jgi:hypothetical protein